MRSIYQGATMAAVLLCVLLHGALLMGQANQVGQQAKEFRVGDTINEASASSLEDAAGDVILIKYWGLN